MPKLFTPVTNAAMFSAEISDLDKRLLGIGTSTCQCVLATDAAVLEYQRDQARKALSTLLDFLDDIDLDHGMTWTARDRQQWFDLAGFEDKPLAADPRTA